VTATNDGGLWRIDVDTVTSEDLRPKLAQIVLGQGWNLYRLDSASVSLDELFLSLTTLGAEEVKQ